MYIQYRNMALLAVLFVLSSCASVKEGSSASCRIVNYGLVSTEELVGINDDKNTFSGQVLEYAGIEIYEKTDRVPVRAGIRFGVEHVFQNIPANEKIKLVIHHPRMVKPNGEQTVLQVSYKKPADGTSYGFDFPYEEVEGHWRFEFWHSNKLLCAKEFTTQKTGS